MTEELQMVANGLFLSRPYNPNDTNYGIELGAWGETVAAICYTLRQNIKNFDDKAFYKATGYADKFYTGN